MLRLAAITFLGPQASATTGAPSLLTMLTNEMIVMVSAAAVVLSPCSTARGIT